MAAVLIVDDDKDFASAAAKVLGDQGHDVRIALDTDAALESMASQRPDLVILDVMFPESASAGLDLARTMRHVRQDLSHIPILLLTALASDEPLGFPSLGPHNHRSLATDFLEKPPDFDTLRRKVAALLESPNAAQAPY